MKCYYFDNAATSWPKPQKVIVAMKNFFNKCGGNPGRSGHIRSIEAGRTVLKTRELLGQLFNIKDPTNIVFTKNCTEALNIVIFGLLRKGDHVITTSMEHNSVLRPLKKLSTDGVEVDIVQAGQNGIIEPSEIFNRIKPNTKLIAVTHSSNVIGAINDIGVVGDFCKKNNILFLVDAAQSAGCIPIDVQKYNIDFLAFAGHKSLMGPQGTGALFVKDAKLLSPLMIGGTGSLSDREDQPDFLPDLFESGTLNAIGIAGLGEGVAYILKKGVNNILDHDRKLLDIFFNELSGDKRIKIYGDMHLEKRAGVASVNIEGMSPSSVGEILEKEFGILTRIGLHCAPRAHKTIGTFPDGTVRFGWGVFTKESDVYYAAKTLRNLSSSKRGGK
jgi:cysteine desulfurase family protein